MQQDPIILNLAARRKNEKNTFSYGIPSRGSFVEPPKTQTLNP